MQGNYRHHYLLAAAASKPSVSSASSLSSPASKPRQQQQQEQQQRLKSQQFQPQQQTMASDLNGLPAARDAEMQQSQISSNSYPLGCKQTSSMQQPANLGPPLGSQQFTGRHLPDQHHRQVRTAAGREYRPALVATDAEQALRRLQQQQQQQQQQQRQHQQLIRVDNNNVGQPLKPKQQQQPELNRRQAHALADRDKEPAPGAHGLQQQSQQEYYASQLRNSQLQHRFTQTSSSSQFSTAQMQHCHQEARASNGLGGFAATQPARPAPGPSTSPQPSKSVAQRDERAHHVNFNRSGQQAGGGDEDEEAGESRKKKYLTAKYGQQQMNLIKKRLKIEMWLYEQLQELAKGSKAEVSNPSTHLQVAGLANLVWVSLSLSLSLSL